MTFETLFDAWLHP